MNGRFLSRGAGPVDTFVMSDELPLIVLAYALVQDIVDATVVERVLRLKLLFTHDSTGNPRPDLPCSAGRLVRT